MAARVESCAVYPFATWSSVLATSSARARHVEAERTFDSKRQPTKKKKKKKKKYDIHGFIPFLNFEFY